MPSVTQPLCMNAHLALAGPRSDHTTELVVVRILLLQDECVRCVKSGFESSKMERL